jgi:hypothetical protein
MFNWIQPNYDQVSWKPIYESFMKEIAWRTIHTPNSDLGLSGDIARYHNSAQKKVLNVLKDFGAYVETKSWVGVPSETFQVQSNRQLERWTSVTSQEPGSTYFGNQFSLPTVFKR